MKTTKYSPEVKARAVRLVLKHQGEYPSQWAVIESIAAKIGCTAETLRGRVRQHERDSGLRDGVTTAERERVKALERENKELRRAFLDLLKEEVDQNAEHADEQFDADFALMTGEFARFLPALVMALGGEVAR